MSLAPKFIDSDGRVHLLNAYQVACFLIGRIPLVARYASPTAPLTCLWCAAARSPS